MHLNVCACETEREVDMEKVRERGREGGIPTSHQEEMEIGW